MFEHKKMRQMISAYLDQEVSPNEKDQVEKHMATCSACRKYFQQLNSLKTALKQWPEETLSPDLEQKIQTQIANFKAKERDKMKNKRLVLVGVSGSFLAVILMMTFGQMSLKKGVQTRMFDTVVQLAKVSKEAPLSMRGAADDISEEQFLPGNERMQLVSRQYEPDYLNSGYVVAEKKNQSSSEEDKNSPEHSEYSGLIMMETSYDAVRESPGPVIHREMKFGLEPGSIVVEHDGYVIPESEFFNRGHDFDSEEYEYKSDNAFEDVLKKPLSTFSIDVDTASYSNIRRFLNENQMPPQEAVRIEEMVNYFTYHYPQPKEEEPFSTILEAGVCPWNKTHRLIMIGLQGKELDFKNTPPAHLVFLIDVSGSMADDNKLSLLKDSLRVLVNHLRAKDKVSIVTYSSTAKIVLKPTLGLFKPIIINAIDHLSAGGSTAGAEGLNLAYKVAQDHLIKGGNNRVILSTDGDFNVGPSADYEIERLIEQKRKSGVFLTVLGFGTGNLKDSKMQKLADKGNGNYAYIADIEEAKKVLESQLAGTLFTVAKDVKIQVEFNPAQIKGYRLIGYENRKAKAADFVNDRKDGGDLGAGHSVTAFYEVVLADEEEDFEGSDPLKYQKPEVVNNNELLTLKIRYKDPDQKVSKEFSRILDQIALEDNRVSQDFKFATSVVEFGLLLRNSPYKEEASYQRVLKRAQQAIGEDVAQRRQEFLELVEQACQLLGIDNEEEYQGLKYRK